MDDLPSTRGRTISLNDIEIFIKLFKILRKKELNNALFDKLQISRQVLLKNIKEIMESISSSINIFNTNNMESFIQLIWQAGKLIEEIYHTSYEKTSFKNILEIIMTKTALKYNPTLFDEILKYSVSIVIKFQKEKFDKIDKITKKSLEIIAFVIMYKIEYTKDYYFIGKNNSSQKSQDIYSNLPYNYPYLRAISYIFMSHFSTSIGLISDFESMEQFKEKIFIQCLKVNFNSLYLSYYLFLMEKLTLHLIERHSGLTMKLYPSLVY